MCNEINKKSIYNSIKKNTSRNIFNKRSVKHMPWKYKILLKEIKNHLSKWKNSLFEELILRWEYFPNWSMGLMLPLLKFQLAIVQRLISWSYNSYGNSNNPNNQTICLLWVPSRGALMVRNWVWNQAATEILRSTAWKPTRP